MIENYFTLIETLRLSKKQPIFIILSVCALMDLILSSMLFVNRVFYVTINYSLVKILIPLTIILFFVFSYRYAVSKQDDFKHKMVYLSIMIIFTFVSTAVYSMLLMTDNEAVFYILMASYSIYTLTRLIFVIHKNYYKKKRNGL